MLARIRRIGWWLSLAAGVGGSSRSRGRVAQASHTGRVMPKNVEIVQRFLMRVNERDVDRAFDDVAADAQLDWSRSDAPDSGVYRGPEGWRDWLAGRQEALSGVRFDSTELFEASPDHVVLVARAHARGRASGIDMDSLGAAVWTLRGRQITRLTLYQTRGDALKAVGLEP